MLSSPLGISVHPKQQHRPGCPSVRRKVDQHSAVLVIDERRIHVTSDSNYSNLLEPQRGPATQVTPSVRHQPQRLADRLGSRPQTLSKCLTHDCDRRCGQRLIIGEIAAALERYSKNIEEFWRDGVI